jgi:hypothetical protein
MDGVARYNQINRTELLDAIRTWYNGYSWDGETSVYNPFSTLLLFEKKQFDNYWFRTGTPTFLMNLLQSHNQLRPVLEPIEIDSSIFDGYDPADIDEISLLFQTGYLTIKEKKLSIGLSQYTLVVPNSEVRDSFLKHLLSAYSHYPINRLGLLVAGMQQQISKGDASGLEQNLRMLLANIPSILHIKQEAYYHSLFLVWMKMLGFDMQSEVLTNIGRIDAVWHQPGLTVVAEIKYGPEKDADRLLNEAITQIHERRYYEKYQDRKVFLMAVAFAGKEVKCRIEEAPKWTPNENK